MEHLMQQLFDFLSAAGREVALFIVSMVPLIELRGSIPLGAALGMPWYTVFLISIVGNLLPVPFILLLGRPIFQWLKTTRLLSGFAARYEKRLMSKADKVTRYETIGLCMFVGIPVPGTGAGWGLRRRGHRPQREHPAVGLYGIGPGRRFVCASVQHQR